MFCDILNLSLLNFDSKSTSKFLKKKLSTAHVVLQKFNKSKIAIIKIDNLDNDNNDDFNEENDDSNKNNESNKNIESNKNDESNKNNKSNKNNEENDDYISDNFEKDDKSIDDENNKEESSNLFSVDLDISENWLKKLL